MKKILTGTNATLSVNGNPILWAPNVTYDIYPTCSCPYPSVVGGPGVDHRAALFNLLHKLLHLDKYNPRI